MGQRPDEMARVQARTGRTRKDSFPQSIHSGEQGLPLLPISAKQHQAQAVSSVRVEISARKYYPDLTRTERVLRGGEVVSLYYREQKHICGRSYDTAGYMEVDLYPVTAKQHRASRRAKKKEASTLAQQTYNDNRSKRYHVQLVNTNFGKGDFSWTGTYDDVHLPEPGDTRRADLDFSNYIKRLYRWCDKHGVERPKWVAATEYTTIMEGGAVCGRHHHHAIIQHTEGLNRDVLEELWSDKNGNRIGLTRGEYLDVDHGSVESLVRYISKNKRCARSWRQSRGLEKPKTPPPNDSRWSRRKLDEASTVYIDDAAFWEKKYPGYTLNRVETKVSDAGLRHTVVILRRAECWHGRGDITKARRKRE